MTGTPLDNQRQEDFCQHLAANKTQPEAYVLAGYKANDGAASRLAGKVKIRARVAEIRQPVLDRYAVTNDRIIREMALSGFARMGDYKKLLSTGDLDDITSDESAAITEITVDRVNCGKKPTKRRAKDDDEDDVETIRTRIKLGNKHQSLVSLAQIMGLTKEVNLTIPVSFTVEFAAPAKA